MPLPFGSDTCDFFSPTTKMFCILVANTLPDASFTWTMSNEPGCFSMWPMVPTRPALRLGRGGGVLGVLGGVVSVAAWWDGVGLVVEQKQ